MLPILPFAAGLIAGIAAVGLLRSERARVGAARLQDGLREAGESGLNALRRSTTTLRERFAAQPDAPPQATPDATVPAAKPKSPRKKAAAKAVKPAAPRTGKRKVAPAKPGAGA